MLSYDQHNQKLKLLAEGPRIDLVSTNMSSNKNTLSAIGIEATQACACLVALYMEQADN